MGVTLDNPLNSQSLSVSLCKNLLLLPPRVVKILHEKSPIKDGGAGGRKRQREEEEEEGSKASHSVAGIQKTYNQFLAPLYKV